MNAPVKEPTLVFTHRSQEPWLYSNSEAGMRLMAGDAIAELEGAVEELNAVLVLLENGGK